MEAFGIPSTADVKEEVECFSLSGISRLAFFCFVSRVNGTSWEDEAPAGLAAGECPH